MFYHELYYCRFFSQIVWYEVLVCNHVISRQCWGSIEFFFSVNLHYSRVLISSQKREMLLLLTTNMAAVTSRANHQRHQLRINKAANSSRAPTRQSNFCHSNNYLLFIPPPRFWLPEVESHVPAATKDQGSFAKQERQPWERGWSTSNCNRESIHVTPLVDFRISWYMYASASYPVVSLSLDENVRAKEGGRETTGETLRRDGVSHVSSLAVSTPPMVPCNSSPVSRVSSSPLPCEKRSSWGGGCVWIIKVWDSVRKSYWIKHLWHLFSEINYFQC